MEIHPILLSLRVDGMTENALTLLAVSILMYDYLHGKLLKLLTLLMSIRNYPQKIFKHTLCAPVLHGLSERGVGVG